MEPQQDGVRWSEAQIWVKHFKAMLSPKIRSPTRPYPFNGRFDLYQQAKEQETKHRNLSKALELYAKAAAKGERINSCIKDFAAVLHQCGFTKEAIQFLKEMRHCYNGDIKKYDRLMQNFQLQLKPTGKHNYTKLLLNLHEAASWIVDHEAKVASMFGNSSRIRIIERFKTLALRNPSTQGQYILITFDTFSGAKKTLETFDSSQWFAIDKYWVDNRNGVVAQAENSRSDFERGLIVNGSYIERIMGSPCSENPPKVTYPCFQHLQLEEDQLNNLTAITTIENFFHFKLLADLENPPCRIETEDYHFKQPPMPEIYQQ